MSGLMRRRDAIGASQIRRLSGADARDYRDIRLAGLQSAPEAFGSTYAAESPRPLAAYGERIAGSIVFGAYRDGRIVGVIGMKRFDGPKDSHKAFVWGFYVEPSSRRLGIGRLLITALIEAARGVVEQLVLDVVTDNRAAIAAYEQAGFVRFGVEPRSLKTANGYADAVLMSLRLR